MAKPSQVVEVGPTRLVFFSGRPSATAHGLGASAGVWGGGGGAARAQAAPGQRGPGFGLAAEVQQRLLAVRGAAVGQFALGRARPGCGTRTLHRSAAASTSGSAAPGCTAAGSAAAAARKKICWRMTPVERRWPAVVEFARASARTAGLRSRVRSARSARRFRCRWPGKAPPVGRRPCMTAVGPRRWPAAGWSWEPAGAR